MTLDINELERVGKLAWNAPWSVDYDPREDGAHQVIDADSLTVCFMSTPAEDSEENAEFIVCAMNHWPAIIAALREGERLREENERLKSALVGVMPYVNDRDCFPLRVAEEHVIDQNLAAYHRALDNAQAAVDAARKQEGE